MKKVLASPFIDEDTRVQGRADMANWGITTTLQLHACSHPPFRKANRQTNMPPYTYFPVMMRISSHALHSFQSFKIHSNTTASGRTSVRVNPLPGLLAHSSISALRTFLSCAGVNCVWSSLYTQSKLFRLSFWHLMSCIPASHAWICLLSFTTRPSVKEGAMS